MSDPPAFYNSGLTSLNDVATALEPGIDSIQPLYFSLENPVDEFPVDENPADFIFHKFIYSPSNLKGTPALDTLFFVQIICLNS